VIESVALQQPADFSIDFAEVNKDTMKTALLGSDRRRGADLRATWSMK
jgi:hypothetical protein